MSSSSCCWSFFQRLSTADLAIILIVLAVLCFNWPVSFAFVLLGIMLFPIWLMWRVVETSLHNLA